MAEPFLSVIIPVYQVEQYLPRCVESVLAAGVADLEIILVEDGSPDDCGAICDGYAAKDSRVSVIHQPNSGVSVARNNGLRASRGHYVVFVDSDDYLDGAMFARVVDKLRAGRGIDVLIGDFYIVAPDGRLISRVAQIGETPEIIREAAYAETFFSRSGAFWSIWRFILAREFLLTRQLFFREGFICGEDFDYLLRVLARRPHLAYFHAPYYYYVIFRPGSVMSTVSLRRIGDLLAIMQENMRMIMDAPDYPCRGLVADHLRREFVYNLATLAEVAKADRAAAAGYFKEALWLLDGARGATERIALFLVGRLGLGCTGRMLHGVKMVRRLARRIIAEVRHDA